MQSPIVKCIVNECTHYMDGDQCMASKISIYNDAVNGSSVKNQDTQCQSFHQRSSMGDFLGAFHNSNISGTLSSMISDDVCLMPDVECFVNNCKHWHSSNLCNAAQIEVAGVNVVQSADTDCNSFEQK